jgi:hypothetical protein
MSTSKVNLFEQVNGYFTGTKAAIEALTGIGEGALAYASDTDQFGSYNGTTWTWGQGGSLPNPFALTATITPATITATQNDYNPTGGATADVWRLASDANWNISGIAGGTAGRVLILHNIGSNEIRIPHDDSGSLAANRVLPGSGHIMRIRPNQSGILRYDGSSSRWRPLHIFSASSIALEDAGGYFTVDNVEQALQQLSEQSAGMVLIDDQVLGSNTATVNLRPGGPVLPTNYKHLMVDIVARTNRAAAGSEGIQIEINDDTTGSNYAIYVEWHNFDSLMGDTTPASSRIVGYANAANSPTDEFCAYTLHIYDYNSSNKRKGLQCRGGQRIGTGTSDLFIYDAVGWWLSTSPITKIELTGANGGSFITNSRFTLWGLK